MIFKNHMDMITCKNNFDETVTLPADKFVFRPSVYGVMVRDDHVLMLRNKSNGKLWVPGGGINIGEVMEEALKREMREETGLEVRVKDFIFFTQNFFYYQPLDEAYHAFLFFYACELCDEYTADVKGFEADEIEESRDPQWIPRNAIQKTDISDLQDELYHVIMRS